MASSVSRGYLSQQSAGSEASDIGWSEGDPLCRLPYEVLLHLFDCVPPREIVKTCQLVCKGWRCFFEEPSFWQLRMKQHGNYHSKLDHLSGVNWAKLCLYTAHEPNLIKSFDSNGRLSLEPWAIVYQDWSHMSEHYITEGLQQASGDASNVASRQQRGPRGWGGDGWSIEEWIERGKPMDQNVLKENGGCTKNYVTSYYWCCRWQMIDLHKYGFVPEVMDVVQPAIVVSEWFCARWDCGSIFKIKIALLDEDFKFLKTYEHSEETAQWRGGDLGWRKVKHIFRDYGAGVRYVLFLDGGKDTKWWAGHYGSKMAAAHVEINFA